MEEYRCDGCNEKYYRYQTASGYRVCVIPKKGYSKTYALFGTRYGSMDTECRPLDGSEPFAIPDGTAHFMEHKLFEGETEDAFVRYSRTGADANAFTTFDRTVYLFSCTGNFEASFDILLDFVTHPYFTEQTVAKEQGIIGQEIKMYDDSPDWGVVINLLQALFVNNPVRIDTAGTVESIAQITPKILYQCYNTFYNPENMIIVVCGDVDPASVFRQCEKSLKARPHRELARVLPTEPEEVGQARVVRKMSVSKPQFLIGYKEVTPRTGLAGVRTGILTDVLLEALFGKSSEFYEELYEKGLIGNDFQIGYDCGIGYGVSMIGGESDDPDAVLRAVKETVQRAARAGVDEKSFTRARRKHYAAMLKRLNDVEDTALMMMDFDLFGVEFADVLKIFDEITPEDCQKRLQEDFAECRCALSIIEPIG